MEAFVHWQAGRSSPRDQSRINISISDRMIFFSPSFSIDSFFPRGEKERERHSYGYSEMIEQDTVVTVAAAAAVEAVVTVLLT